MTSGVLHIVLAGDLVLDEPDPRHWLSGIAPALRVADLAIGHLEVPHTDCRDEVAGGQPHFAMRRVSSPGEIYPVFRELFSGSASGSEERAAR